MKGLLNRHPVMVAIAGPNGAGKTTFFHAHIKSCGLRYLDPDAIAAGLRLSPRNTAEAVSSLRATLTDARESFAFETVFSDPVGDKVSYLRNAADSGYTVVLCFIGLASHETSDQRVAMRVSQGGHDIPSEKLRDRYPRTLENLRRAIQELPHVYVFDNEDLQTPYRKVAVFKNGDAAYTSDPLPAWLTPLLPRT